MCVQTAVSFTLFQSRTCLIDAIFKIQNPILDRVWQVTLCDINWQKHTKTNQQSGWLTAKKFTSTQNKISNLLQFPHWIKNLISNELTFFDSNNNVIPMSIIPKLSKIYLKVRVVAVFLHHCNGTAYLLSKKKIMAVCHGVMASHHNYGNPANCCFQYHSSRPKLTVLIQSGICLADLCHASQQFYAYFKKTPTLQYITWKLLVIC